MQTWRHGDNVAVIATMVDWKQAFPRQCPTQEFRALSEMV